VEKGTSPAIATAKNALKMKSMDASFRAR